MRRPRRGARPDTRGRRTARWGAAASPSPTFCACSISPTRRSRCSRQGALSEGHGRALLLAEDHAARRRLARTAAADGWSVRTLEARARDANAGRRRGRSAHLCVAGAGASRPGRGGCRDRRDARGRARLRRTGARDARRALPGRARRGLPGGGRGDRRAGALGRRRLSGLRPEAGANGGAVRRRSSPDDRDRDRRGRPVCCGPLESPGAPDWRTRGRLAQSVRALL